MEGHKILWVDDEIERLKPHIIFLTEKGYKVDTADNGEDALEMAGARHYDMIFLDEMMDGMDGLETLQRIKAQPAAPPVVMITKSEEESIMEHAIGAQISDYLIKPVNPKQILLTLKKHLDTSRLVSETTTSNYQQQFRQIGMDLATTNSWEEWIDLFKRLTYWELELDKIEDDGLKEILGQQKSEANAQFFRFMVKNYQDWLHHGDGPVMSHTLVKNWLLPELAGQEKIFFVVIDNLRYDQWKIIQPILQQYYNTVEEKHYYSILPTATMYARNALFSGLMPLEIKKRFPDKWTEEYEEESKNRFEEHFFDDQLQRHGHRDVKWSYHKITSNAAGKKLVDKFSNLLGNTLNVLVYNFVDMLSHSKTDMEVIRELADTDKGYRSLTESWIKNSPLLDLLKKAAEQGLKVILTTDHGTINVTDPTKLVGEKSINTNLRYKTGRNMSYQHKDVYRVKDPEQVFLPRESINSEFIFAREALFFAYPNNFNHYVKYYRNTYQHGGLSLEEVIVPYVVLKSK